MIDNMENMENDNVTVWRRVLPWLVCVLLGMNVLLSGACVWLLTTDGRLSRSTADKLRDSVAAVCPEPIETVDALADLSVEAVEEEPEETPGERIARSQEAIRQTLGKMRQEAEQERRSADAVGSATGGTYRTDVAASSCPEFVRTTSGMSLRNLARRYYGSEVFWVCIYDHNSQVLRSPDVLPLGIRLALPRPADYGIDADDPASLRRARALAKNLAR